MPRIQLLPYDPTASVVRAVVDLLKTGVPAATGITPAGQPSWNPDTAACPAGHYLFPAGWWLYNDRRPVTEMKFPQAFVYASEDGKQKGAVLNGRWRVDLRIRLLTRKDADLTVAETIIQRLQLILTEPITLDDNTVQAPQTRLSTSTLHVFGTNRNDNFEETASGRLTDEQDHPNLELATMVDCGLTAE